MPNIAFLKEKLSELQNPNEDMETWYIAVIQEIPNDNPIHKELKTFAGAIKLGAKGKTFGTHEGNKQKAKKYLEEYIKNLESKPNTDSPVNSMFNHTNISNANIQVNSLHSHQTLNIQQQKNELSELIRLLREDIKHIEISPIVREDLETEINYVERNVQRGNRVDTALLNIGTMIKSIGSNVFSNLIASPIFEIVKPYLGF